jgi:hypothetical protein
MILTKAKNGLILCNPITDACRLALNVPCGVIIVEEDLLSIKTGI